MEKTNNKAKLVLSLFLIVLVLSGAEGGRYVPEKHSEVIPNNQQLWGWWPFLGGWFGHFPFKAGLNTQNYLPESKTTTGNAIGNDQQLWGWWPFWGGWFKHFPFKAGLNKQNYLPESKTAGDANVAAASTMFP